MNSSVLLRSSLLLAALGAALSAHAVVIGVEAHGQFANPTAMELVSFQNGGFGALSSFEYTTTNVLSNSLGGEYNGTGFYLGAGSDRLDISFELAPSTSNNGTITYSGAWTATGGTGSYAGASGGGTLGLNFYDLKGVPGVSQSLSILSGNMRAVPEPASIAALGVGTIGILRRRRKA
jgi:hypothetical protein